MDMETGKLIIKLVEQDKRLLKMIGLVEEQVRELAKLLAELGIIFQQSRGL